MTGCQIFLLYLLSKDPDSGIQPVWFARELRVDMVDGSEVFYEVKDESP